VKEQLRRALALCREVAYITLSSFRVKRLFCFSLSAFSVELHRRNPADPAACLPLFRVSGGAL
ncbi:hypothetical protein, partial [Klebsiella variicola]|uniref:hypothetical protein n=1 Tax=Klebsiella variicola TaxID=244366 RepID=UPI00280ABF4F